MKKTLIVVGHPNPNSSLANETIASELGACEGVTVRRLAETFRESYNIADEQNALVEADIIVLQFPLNWMNIPWVMKKWFEDVFQVGFAYGEGGDKLVGKSLIISMTVGGNADDFRDGAGGSFDQFLAHVRNLAQFTGMEYQGQIVSGGLYHIPYVMGDKKEITAKALLHAEELKNKLNQLSQS